MAGCPRPPPAIVSARTLMGTLPFPITVESWEKRFPSILSQKASAGDLGISRLYPFAKLPSTRISTGLTEQNERAGMTLDISVDGPLQVIQGPAGSSPMTIDQALLESEFRRSGALLLRGFEFDVETFGRFAERLCTASVFNESRNRALIDPASNIQSVDLGTAPFPLHPELSREPWRPDVCLFACFGAPSRGGS